MTKLLFNHQLLNDTGKIYLSHWYGNDENFIVYAGGYFDRFDFADKS